MSEIDLSVTNRIATITLNRPESLNAMNPAMREQLIEIFDATDTDDAVRVVVITGAGRGFCSGADISAGAASFSYDSENDVRLRDGGGRIALRVFESRKPLIAAINGAAVGFGASFTLPMDFRLASSAAKFGFVATSRGIVPDAVSSWFLPRIVGTPTALDWTLTARLFDAQEALQRGLVRSVHPPDELLDAAYALASQIMAASAPLSAAVTRRLIWRMAGTEHPMATHRVDSAAIASLGRTADAAEGVRAWQERRSPEWALSPATDWPDLPWPDDPGFAVTTH